VFEEKNVVGFDIVELCPNKNEKSSDFLAAKLYYKMLSYKFQDEDVEDDFESNFNNGSSVNNKFSKFNNDDEY
jgi:agmatinase